MVLAARLEVVERDEELGVHLVLGRREEVLPRGPAETGGLQAEGGRTGQVIAGGGGHLRQGAVLQQGFWNKRKDLKLNRIFHKINI